MADPNANAIDAAALAAALQNLANAINTMQAAPPARAAPTPVLDPFLSNDPFDLASRAGSTAFTTACSKLDDTWDGTAEKFPAFVIALRVRAVEANWVAAAPRGITTIAGKNLLTDYHSITDTEIELDRAARTNDRAIQNSKAMYRCIKSSITGDLRATLLDQAATTTPVEDGPTLFKKLTKYTMMSTSQLMLQSLRSILDFDPAEHDFSIPTINTKLNHLFMLATTPRRTLHDDERISHTIAVYAKIKQPELWAQWVREQMNAINNGTITNAQDFMNSAVLEYNHVCGQNGGAFNGSGNTLTEDIVAMIAAKQKKPQKDVKEIKPEQKPSAKKLPPFLKHFKDGLGDSAKPYKLGDTKTWNNETWYFCDCPSHRDKAKWHTHPPESCRTRLRWLAKKKGNVEANQVESVEETQNEDTDGHSQPDTAAAMLSKVLQLAGDNEMAKSLIADALIALENA